MLCHQRLSWRCNLGTLSELGSSEGEVDRLSRFATPAGRCERGDLKNQPPNAAFQERSAKDSAIVCLNGAQVLKRS